MINKEKSGGDCQLNRNREMSALALDEIVVGCEERDTDMEGVCGPVMACMLLPASAGGLPARAEMVLAVLSQQSILSAFIGRLRGGGGGDDDGADGDGAFDLFGEEAEAEAEAEAEEEAEDEEEAEEEEEEKEVEDEEKQEQEQEQEDDEAPVTSNTGHRTPLHTLVKLGVASDLQAACEAGAATGRVSLPSHPERSVLFEIDEPDSSSATPLHAALLSAVHAAVRREPTATERCVHSVAAEIARDRARAGGTMRSARLTFNCRVHHTGTS